MRNFMKALALGSCVVAGPLLATTAMSISGYSDAEEAPDDDFSLDRVFIAPTEPTPQYCWDNGDGTGGCIVTGGGSCSDSWNWDWCYGGGGGGGGSSSAGGGGGGGEPGPSNPFGIGITGRECTAERQAADTALTFLYNNSQTARMMIDTMANQGTNIFLVKDISGDQEYIGYDPALNHIRWDPFVSLRGTNSDGSEFDLSPLMVLAHELVHASLRGQPLMASETHAMQIANQIAQEVNTSTGSSFNTNRNVYETSFQFYVNSIEKSGIGNFELVRPGCG